MFITPAYAATSQAATTATAHAPDGLSAMLQTPIVPLILVFMIFYLMVIRPQNQRAAHHRRMVSDLQKGDKVVTGGGIIGTVKKVVSDEEVMVEIADNVQVRVARSTIMGKKN